MSIQDSISFSLKADKTVVNNTVKVMVGIAATVTPETEEDVLKGKLQSMMKEFIPDAKWAFSGIDRKLNASGVEEITSTASTRISERENVGLERRKQEVSTPGLSITNVKTDTTPQTEMIEEAESDLRIMLLTKATKEQNKINESLGTNYRLGSVVFSASTDANLSNLSNSYSKHAMMAAATSMSYFDEGVGGSAEIEIGNSVKLIMTALINLNVTVTTSDIY